MTNPEYGLQQHEVALRKTGLQFIIPLEENSALGDEKWQLGVSGDELKFVGRYTVKQPYEPAGSDQNTVTIALLCPSNEVKRKFNAKLFLYDTIESVSGFSIEAQRICFNLGELSTVDPMIADPRQLFDPKPPRDNAVRDGDFVDKDPALIYEIFGNLVAAFYANITENDAYACIAKMNGGRILQRLGLDAHVTDMDVVVRNHNAFDVPLSIENNLCPDISLTLCRLQDEGTVEPGAIVKIITSDGRAYTIRMGGFDNAKRITFKNEQRSVVTRANGEAQVLRTENDWKELRKEMFGK